MGDAPDLSAINAQDTERGLLSIRPKRLALPHQVTDRIPSYAELRLTPLMREALEWQMERSGMWFLEMSTGVMPARRDRFHEIGGLFGSTAEAVILAGAAEVEIELLRRGIDKKRVPESLGMCQRFFAEAICQTVIGVTNRMLNIGFRVVMIHSGYPWGTACSKRLLQPFQPFSNRREDWVGLSELKAFGEITRASRAVPLRRLHGALSRLAADDVWAAVDEQRGEDHHRWRYESPHVDGLNKRSPWMTQPGAVSFDGPTAAYVDADRIVEEVCEVAHNGLIRLTRAMREFRLAFAASAAIVTDGSLSFDSREKRFEWKP